MKTNTKKKQHNPKVTTEDLKSLVENANDGFVVAKGEGVFVYANKRMAEMTGYRVDELIGLTIRDLLHPDEFKKVMDRYKKRIAGKSILKTYESVFVKKNGESLPVELTAAKTIWQGEPADLGIIRDISERKSRDAEIRQLARIVESSDDAIIGGTLDGTIFSWNHGAERLYGYSEKEIRGKLITMLIPPERRDEHPGILSKIKNGEVIDHYETIRMRKGGKRINVSLTASPIKDASGKIVGVSSIARDVTERKLFEEERDRFFNISLDMLCIAGFDGYFKQLNPSWSKTLGWSNEELMSKPYLEFVHPDDRRPTVEAATDLAEGQIIITFDNRYLCKDGSYKWISWNSIPIIEEKLIYAVARDVTEQTRAQEEIEKLNKELEHRTIELEAINKELEAFSYSVSHDLRAPLRSIDGFSKILLDDYEDTLDDEGKDCLQRVRAASQRMACFIDDMLKLSHITRFEMRRQPVDLSKLAREIISDLKTAHPDRNVDFKIRSGVTANVDPHLFRIVLENLIGNAMKFSSKRPYGKIEFGFFKQETGPPVYFVRDNGAGFDMNFAYKLFGVFQRLHSSSEFPGTGVGLATVQRVINRHRGRVWAEGAEDKGATFFFTTE